MTRLLKRQLNETEKETIVRQHGRACFATGHTIPEPEDVQFDHIKAYALGGVSELNNIAPMCSTHNRAKGTLPLYDFRMKLQMEEFFGKGDRLTLQDLLYFFKARGDISEYAIPVSVVEEGDQFSIVSPNETWHFGVSRCPVTDWRYFYATLPVELINSDDEQESSIGLQPRYLIFDKVFGLFRHFQQHPVLQPSLGRIVKGRIRLFDGQHKAAALLWNGRKELECKIYVDHDVRLLNQTNISAHEKFAQTRFFSSIMVLKLGSQFKGDFETYRDLEDGQPKTEAGFMEYLRAKDNLTRGEANKRFRSYLHNAILESEGNKLAHYVSSGNRRTREKPLTIDMISRSVFSCFLNQTPTSDNIATDSYKRDVEIQNIVKMLNMFVDLALHEWNPKGSRDDAIQRKLERIFGSKPMMAWAEILRDAICAQVRLYDTDEKIRPFYRNFSDDDMDLIREVVNRLLEWKRWDSPANDEIDRFLADNKSALKEWFRSNGLTTGYLMGAPE